MQTQVNQTPPISFAYPPKRLSMEVVKPHPLVEYEWNEETSMGHMLYEDGKQALVYQPVKRPFMPSEVSYTLRRREYFANLLLFRWAEGNWP